MKKYRSAYFIGIGGIGMSAIARFFKHEGMKVWGYDKTPTHLTDALISEGIPVHFDDEPVLLPAEIRALNNIEEILVIYTPAVPRTNKELNYFRKNGFVVKKRSEVLGEITQNRYTIAVAGTHGKTTTSSMIAHLLKQSDRDCTAFLGGITKNYHSNLLLPSGNSFENKYETPVVVEADEYDRSFLTLHPDVAIITSMDADHLDVYGDQLTLQNNYRKFASNIKSGGILFSKQGLGFDDCTTYSVDSDSDIYATEIRLHNLEYSFAVSGKMGEIRDLSIKMPGLHNIENAVAAVAVGKYLGIHDDQIRSAMKTYTGVERRFDIQFHNSSTTFIDDYAHHPEEIKACLNSVRLLFKGKKVLGIFQPHLYTRTRDFAEEFSESLSLLDDLILLDIYPARELPIEGISSQMLLEKVRCSTKCLLTNEQTLEEIRRRNIEVLVTIGAGDIDRLVEPIKNILNEKYRNQ